MQPITVKMSGFKGIHHGLGLTELSIDIEKLTDGAELVALVAANGKGKTTLLDNLQPYRLMPSKIRNNTSYSPDAFSFYNELMPGDSGKELVWSHKGRTYRTIFEWRITEKTTSTVAYLQVLAEDGNWQPYAMADGTTSDGKAKTYDRCLEDLLGSPRLYFTAAFSAQGRSQLSSYTQGDVKTLMSEVLGLSAISELGESANEVVKGLSRELANQRKLIGELPEKQKLKSDYQAKVEDLAADAASRESVVGSAKEKARELTIQIADLERDMADMAGVALKRDALAEKIRSINDSAAGEIADAEKDLAVAQTDKSEIATRVATAIDRLQAESRKSEERLDQLQGIIAKADDIRRATQDLETLQRSMREAEARRDELQTVAVQLQQKGDGLKTVIAHMENLKSAGLQLHKQEEDLQGQCALTREVPCQGTDLQGQCKLLSSAVEAEGRIPEITNQIKVKRDEYRAAKTQHDQLTKEQEGLREAKEQAETAKLHAQGIATALSEAQRLSAMQGELERAESDIEGLRAAIEDYRARVTEREEEGAQEQARIEERMQSIEARISRAKSQRDESVAAIQQELGMLPTDDNTERLEAAKKQLAELEKMESDARDKLTECRESIAQHRARIQVIESEIEAIEPAAKMVEHIEGEINYWQLLTKALGRDGILSLSIDDAGPTLSSLTNDLLMACYGPRFTVRIDTQAENKQGIAKETFDIVVFDADVGESRSVRDMSGGEKIWINEALTRAIALYQAQLAGNTFDTLFSDESDGALDPEKKGQFVRMKRKVLELGGYNREIFISHSPEVWPLADGLIELESLATEK